jgi:hypothetical protein
VNPPFISINQQVNSYITEQNHKDFPQRVEDGIKLAVYFKKYYFIKKCVLTLLKNFCHWPIHIDNAYNIILLGVFKNNFLQKKYFYDEYY